MNKFLPYQLISKDYDLTTPPDRFTKLKSKQDFQEQEGAMIDAIIPAFYNKQRAFSIPNKILPRQLQISNLQKRLSSLRQDQERINIELIKHQSFRYNIRNPKTVFERHFSLLQEQLKGWEEEKLKIGEQIREVKKEIYLLENQSDIYQTKKNINNKSVFLNQLVVIEKKITSTKQLPKLRSCNNSLYSYQVQNNSKQNITQQESIVNLLDSGEEGEGLNSYHKLAKIVKNLPSLQQIANQLDEIVLEVNGQLQSHKTILKIYRLKKYEKFLISNATSILKPKKSKRIYFIVIYYCCCLIKETKQSQQKYTIISHKYQKANFQSITKELQYFINNTIMKQIVFKINKLQQQQKIEGKLYKLDVRQLAEDICREILFRLFNHKFSTFFYNYFYSISTVGYQPLNNFHCSIIKSKFVLSEYFNYFLVESKKIVFFEFIILKNIIFYGLFIQAKELLGQFKLDQEDEIIFTAAVIFFELFLKSQDTSILYVNLKHFSNSLADGPLVQQSLKQIEQIKIKLLANLQINTLTKHFNQMLEKQGTYQLQQ